MYNHFVTTLNGTKAYRIAFIAKVAIVNHLLPLTQIPQRMVNGDFLLQTLRLVAKPGQLGQESLWWFMLDLVAS